MANTKKKKTKSSTTPKRQEPPKPPVNRTARIIGGGVCLLLALCVLVSYFQTSAWILNVLPMVLRGLFGTGYYLFAVILAFIGVVQIRSKEEPVVLRTVSAALLPFFLGVIVHLFANSDGYEPGMSLLGALWNDSQTGTAGGVISGGIAVGFNAVFGKAITLILFIVLFIVFVFFALRTSPKKILEKHREYTAQRQEYDRYQEEQKTGTDVAVNSAFSDRTNNRRKKVIDIPLDDETTEAKGDPLNTENRDGFFEKKHSNAIDDVVAAHAVTEKPAEKTRSTAFDWEKEVQLKAPEDLSSKEKKEEPVKEETAKPTVATPQRKTTLHIPEEELESEEKKVEEEIEKKEKEEAEKKETYRKPSIELLDPIKNKGSLEAGAEQRNNSRKLAETLTSFGVDALPGEVIHGPSVTRYEFTLQQGVKLSKITNLSDDIALALGASGVRIAPVPNKESAVGIEVPNRATSAVQIREVIDTPEFQNHKSNTAFAIGKDIGGNSIVGNIGKLPHVLIAGTTGSGKSVCTNSLIVSLMYKSTPEDVRFIMVDPKMVELAPYNGIPHLLIPVVTDPKKAAGALQWAVYEMMKRYKTFSENGVKDLESFNGKCAEELQKPEEERNPELKKMASVVVVIDELADLMLVAAKEVEESICRVAQMGRAAGMHLVIATQRPSADVITGLMKANIPSRIAFAVASSMESRIILDTTGAEKLIGKGDMLYFPVGMAKPLRVQGCFITAEEIERVVKDVKENSETNYDQSVIDQIEKVTNKDEKGKAAPTASEAEEDDCDELLPAAVEIILETGQASVSMLQRRLKLGYARAARLVDQMEMRGIVGPFEGSKPRQLLITKDQWQEMKMKGVTDANTTVEEPEISRYGTIMDSIESHDALE